MIRPTTPFTALLSGEFQTGPIKLHSIIFKGLKNVFNAVVGGKCDVNEPITKYRLTPLHVCAMVGAGEEAEELLRRGAKLDAQDWKGNTPPHIAAMLDNQSLLKKFREAAEKSGKKAFEMLNIYQGTPDSITRWLEKKPAPTGVVCLYKDSKGMHSLTSADFQKLTGASYSARVIVTSEGLVKEWMSPPRVSGQLAWEQEVFIPQLYKALIEMQKRPLDVYLESEGAPGLGARTRVARELGTVLFIYAGRLYQLIGDSTFLMENINALNDANESSRVNDALPNAMGFRLSVVGVDIFVFVSSELKPDSWIHICYTNNHPVKWGRYKLLELEKLEHLVRGLDIEQALKNYRKMLVQMTDRKTWPTHACALSQRFLRYQISYIFNTPAAMAHVIFKRLLPYEYLEQQLKRGTYLVEDFITWNTSTPDVELTLHYYSAFFKVMKCVDKKSNPAVGQQFLDYLLQNFQKYPVTLACETVLMVRETMDLIVSDEKHWKEYVAETEVLIQTFLKIEIFLTMLKEPSQVERIKKDLLLLFKNCNPNGMEVMRPLIVRYCYLAVSREVYKLVQEILTEAGFPEKTNTENSVATK